jgi:hypothetical protein
VADIRARHITKTYPQNYQRAKSPHDRRSRSNVFRPYDVSTIEISAFIAQEHFSSYSILFTHMIAFRTSPARVSSGYRLRFHSGQRRLVLDISSQLRKCPLTHAISLLLPEPCPVSDAFKVFGCVCRINFTAWDTSIGGRFYQLFFLPEAGVNPMFVDGPGPSTYIRSRSIRHGPLSTCLAALQRFFIPAIN